MTKFSVECARKSHIYRVGENAEFIINSNDASELDVTLSSDTEAIFKRIKLNAPAKISYPMSVAGVLRCSVSTPGGKDGETAECGVAFDPYQIYPTLAEPEDFDDFWAKAKAELAKTPVDFKLEEYKKLSNDKYIFYGVSAANVHNSRVHGFMRVPRISGKLPLLVYVDGAGPGQDWELFTEHLKQVDLHYKNPHIDLVISTHPYEPKNSNAEHKIQHEKYLEQLGTKSYWEENLENGPEKTYFYRAILGTVRLLDCIANRDDIDTEHVIYFGASQGGAFGLYMTALSKHIKAAACGVPALGDLGGFLIGRHPVQSNNMKMREYYKTLLYFDTSYFAARITVPVWISVGFIDNCCFPSSVFAIYNQLKGEKFIVNCVNSGHVVDAEGIASFWHWTGLKLGEGLSN